MTTDRTMTAAMDAACQAGTVVPVLIVKIETNSDPILVWSGWRSNIKRFGFK